MSDVLHTYNPKLVTCALGTHMAHGFADDSFISVEPIGDGTTLVQGPDGEATRSIDPTNSFTIKISLQQQSETNVFLMNRYYMDQSDGNGDFPLVIKDILGQDKFTASECWVTKIPANTKGKAQANREWELNAVFGKFS